MNIATAPTSQLTFRKTARGTVAANNHLNIVQALEALGILPRFDRGALVIGKARRPELPTGTWYGAGRKHKQDLQRYRRELDQLRLQIQAAFDFLPPPRFLEATAEYMAREADFG